MIPRDESLYDLLLAWLDDVRAWYLRAESWARIRETGLALLALEAAESRARALGELAEVSGLLPGCPLPIRMIHGWTRGRLAALTRPAPAADVTAWDDPREVALCPSCLAPIFSGHPTTCGKGAP